MDELRPLARMVLLTVLRNWDKPLTAEAVSAKLAEMGFVGPTMCPERVEMIMAELTDRIWDIDLDPQGETNA